MGRETELGGRRATKSSSFRLLKELLAMAVRLSLTVSQDGARIPGGARYRPVGLAEGSDGSLYISDDQRGRIWRIVYRGKY